MRPALLGSIMPFWKSLWVVPRANSKEQMVIFNLGIDSSAYWRRFNTYCYKVNSVLVTFFRRSAKRHLPSLRRVPARFGMRYQSGSMFNFELDTNVKQQNLVQVHYTHLSTTKEKILKRYDPTEESDVNKRVITLGSPHGGLMYCSLRPYLELRSIHNQVE